MDEIELLEDNVTLRFSPLETILLSETVIFTNTILEFLVEHGCVFIEKVYEDGIPYPDDQQTGLIMIKAAVEAMSKVRYKIYGGGKEAFGEVIPKELDGVAEVYLKILNEIGNVFLNYFITNEEG